MTDPTGPPPFNPDPPEYDPGGVPEESPAPLPPADPWDDRPYDAATRRGHTVTSFE